MKNWLKILLGLGAMSIMGATTVACLVSCTATFGKTTVTINSNGLSWYNKETPTSLNNIKVSTNKQQPATSDLTPINNTLNLPSSVSYNKQKLGACIFTPISPNLPANQISRISWNSQDMMWELYDGDTLVGKYWTPKQTSFIFEITITPDSTSLHLTTNIYYTKIVLNNPS